MSKVTQEVIQKHNSTLCLFKSANLFMDNPYFKGVFRTFIKLNDLSVLIKEGYRLLKKIYKIDDEQLDENGRELKNIRGEILEEAALFIKKFDEDDEESEKDIIEILKLTQALLQIFVKILKEQK